MQNIDVIWWLTVLVGMVTGCAGISTIWKNWRDDRRAGEARNRKE